MLTVGSPEDRSLLHLHPCRRDSAAEVRYELTGVSGAPLSVGFYPPGPGLGPTTLRTINLPLSLDWDLDQNSVLGESQPSGVVIESFQTIYKWLQNLTTHCERCKRFTGS